MKFSTFKLFIDLYNQIDKKNINEKKNKSFNKIINNIIDNSDKLYNNDSYNFNLILKLINLKSFNSYQNLLKDKLSILYTYDVLIDHLISLYGEKTTYNIIIQFNSIKKYYGIYLSLEKEQELEIFILNKQSKSNDKDLQSKATLNLIKIKRSNKKYNTLDEYYDVDYDFFDDGYK